MEVHMSFFAGIRTDYMPGPICGNPLNCLNEKICLQNGCYYASTDGNDSFSTESDS